MNIPISKIKPSPLNESVYGKITDGDVADLIESIRELGLDDDFMLFLVRFSFENNNTV